MQDINKKGKKERKYTFEYDGLSRLKEAIYTSAVNNEAYGTSYQYDKHGNIMSLIRNGRTTKNYDLVDDLKMTYVGNQLTKVRDEVKGVSLSESADFQNFAGDNGLMTYNRNGALASDSHKGITSIQYNFLNLPTSITVGGVGVPVNGNIQYTYSASGIKLQTIHTENNDLQRVPMMGISTFGIADATVTKTDYVGNKVYENDKLKRILIDGGYYDAQKKKYFYYLTDHLGNNRVVAEANGTIVQQTQYYPFGMAFADHEGEDEQPYKYNGKELDRRLRLNTYDYSARHLSLEVPRFLSMDPLAEKYYSISPYVYVFNNPLKYIDPDGRQGRRARPFRETQRDMNLARYSRGNVRYRAAYYHTGGIMPASTKTTRTYGVPGSNLRRQPLPNSPIENVHTVGGGIVQMSRNNEFGKGVTASIETFDHGVQLTEVFKQLYTENGPKTEKSYSLEFADPLQKALFEGQQEAYNQVYSARETELKEEGKLNTSEIASKIVSEIGYSPKNKLIISFIMNQSRMELIKEEKEIIPEFRQN